MVLYLVVLVLMQTLCIRMDLVRWCRWTVAFNDDGGWRINFCLACLLLLRLARNFSCHGVFAKLNALEAFVTFVWWISIESWWFLSFRFAPLSIWQISLKLLLSVHLLLVVQSSTRSKRLPSKFPRISLIESIGSGMSMRQLLLQHLRLRILGIVLPLYLLFPLQSPINFAFAESVLANQSSTWLAAVKLWLVAQWS